MRYRTTLAAALPSRGDQSRQTRIILSLTIALSLGLGGCKQQEEAPPPPPAERVENAQLGVAIAALPAVLRVTANDGATIELVPAAEGGTGSLSVAAGEAETGGINLVAAVEGHKAEIVAREGGEYKGQRELGSQLGTAFYSRGHYPGDDGATVEETVIFLVHPWGDRTLQLIYRYPAADDTQVRIQEHLFSLLGELEALPPPEGA